DLQIRYRKPARYDDMIRIRSRIRDVASRRVIFEYDIEAADSGTHLADAETTLICLDQQHQLSRLPDAVITALGGRVRRPGG
ncbi:MAG: thioesterase family protein, partial [Gemmatimonadota bacterium]